MKTKRRILLAACALGLALGVAASPLDVAFASATKVGNGDDGGDLEGAEPISSGVIWETRKKALELLKGLNVRAVPGLGTLQPELERSELLLAKMNVKPKSEKGTDPEVSADGQNVYARTFAEPHAATRFFPASLTLSEDQLVALHIHEALHRSLPPEVREDEDVVTHLTMAMTSPGATFDRVSHVSRKYLSLAPERTETHATAQIVQARPRIEKEKTKTAALYELHVHVSNPVRKIFDSPGFDTFMHGVGLKFSPFGVKPVGQLAVEPVFKVKGYLLRGSDWTDPSFGPIAAETQFLTQLDDASIAGFFVRGSLKSLDAANSIQDRDVLSIGGSYSNRVGKYYFGGELVYTLPSEEKLLEEIYTSSYDRPIAFRYRSIYSATARAGLAFSRVSVGGVAELHVSDGREAVDGVDRDAYALEPGDSLESNRFAVITMGPEVEYQIGKAKLGLRGKWIMNRPRGGLETLGDVVDRGGGQGEMSASASYEL